MFFRVGLLLNFRLRLPARRRRLPAGPDLSGEPNASQGRGQAIERRIAWERIPIRQLLFYLNQPGVNGTRLHFQLMGQPSKPGVLSNQFLFVHAYPPNTKRLPPAKARLGQKPQLRAGASAIVPPASTSLPSCTPPPTLHHGCRQRQQFCARNFRPVHTSGPLAALRQAVSSREIRAVVFR